MPATLTMPKLSPTMEEGTIVKWHKKVGDAIQSGDLLMEVATDKATVEYNALDEGWMRQILVEEGKEARVNQAIAIVSADPQESLEGYQPEGLKKEPPAAQKPAEPETAPQKAEESVKQKEAAPQQQPRFMPEAPLENYAFEFPAEKTSSRVLASPLAKKLAKEKGLDLSSVKGTGPNQRIMSRDLEKAQPAGAIGFGKRDVPATAPGSYEEISLSPMRKVIGQRLQESKSFIPHFYVSHTLDAEQLAAMREQFKKGEIKVTINDFVVKACALALKQHPHINRGFNSVNQSLIQFKTIDIAIAVSLESGLITPVIRHADFKNLGELAVESRLLAQKARDGKLTPEQYKGGSFTISNLGMYGVTHFQAILNPPQAAILAVGGIQETPVVRGGLVVPGKTLALTLSVDHRVIDGVAAAQFLQTLKYLLENPVLLVI